MEKVRRNLTADKQKEQDVFTDIIMLGFILYITVISSDQRAYTRILRKMDLRTLVDFTRGDPGRLLDLPGYATYLWFRKYRKMPVPDTALPEDTPGIVMGEIERSAKRFQNVKAAFPKDAINDLAPVQPMTESCAGPHKLVWKIVQDDAKLRKESATLSAIQKRKPDNLVGVPAPSWIITREEYSALGTDDADFRTFLSEYPDATVVYYDGIRCLSGHSGFALVQQNHGIICEYVWRIA